MKRILCLIVLLSSLVIIPGLTGCRTTSNDIISGTGTIRLSNLEGGFYGIIGDDGRRYDPLNLKPEFQRDGLRVRFEAKIREDVATIHMWGIVIEITKIKKLK